MYIQSKHAPVMVLMGNAATMARPRSVELAGSFMDIYRTKQVNADEIQTCVSSSKQQLRVNQSMRSAVACVLWESVWTKKSEEERNGYVCVGERVTL